MTKKNNSDKRIKKYVWSVFLLLFIILIYLMIFLFSEQDGEESGSISKAISKQCVELLDRLDRDSWSETLKQEIAADMEHPIRKLAHFSEYALLAVAVYCLCRLWLPDNKWMRLGVLFWIFLSALMDEWHQSFVPGRYCSIWDVLLDTCGGAFGMCLVMGIKLWNNKRLNPDKQ